jgi:hypothetical protein
LAIEFARMRFISRRAGGCAVRSAAYNARETFREEVSGRRYCFGDDAVRSAAYNARIDLVSDDGRVYAFQRPSAPEHHEVMLPAGADPRFRDAAVLANAVNQAEKRKDAQLWRELVLALPANKEITREHRIELVRSFADEHFVSKGLAVQLDWHVPHNAETATETANFHCHCLITTRRIEGDHLASRKAADLDPQVRFINGQRIVTEAERWGKMWRAHQENYFTRNGIDITVDPLSAEPGQHFGPVRFRTTEQQAEFHAAKAAQRAEREKAALDRTHEQRHEPAAKVKRFSAEVIPFHPAPDRAEIVAGIIEGWHKQPEPAPAPREGADYLARDLLQTIKYALGSRDPAEQHARLLEGVDRAVYVNADSEAPQSELATSLMRVATAALSVDEPEAVLVEGTREAIRRHAIRVQQAEAAIAREQAAQSPAVTQDTRKPIEAAIAPETPEARPAAPQRPVSHSIPPSPIEQRQIELTHKAIALRREHGTAEKAIEHDTTNREVANYRIEERRQEIGFFRRQLHDHTRFKDHELMYYDGQRRGAEYGIEKQSIKLKAVADQLATVEAQRKRLRQQQAAQEFWKQEAAEGALLRPKSEQRQEQEQSYGLEM